MCSYSYCNNSSETSKNLQSLSSLLKLVGEETRLRLLCILKDGGEHCVCELVEHADDLSQSLISHHLSDLKTAGIVKSKKIGLRAYYSLTKQGLYVMYTIFSLTNTENELRDKQTKSCCGPSADGDAVANVESTIKTAAASSEKKCCEAGNCAETKSRNK